MGRLQKGLLAALLSARVAVALPENGQVVQGQIQILQPGANALQILQNSPTGIINWGSFNIGQGQLVQFLQPGQHSAVLNRVIGQDPSQILGQLQANGQVILVNPNGILFGPGSSVNAGSFMATTLALDDQDFLQGRYNLHQEGPLRAVVNQGEIRVTEGGFIALVSPLVENQGVLLAERGQVVLGASTQASLSVDARGLLQVALGQPPQSPGPVMLTPEQMTDTLASLVRGPAQESQRIVETSQGFKLLGAEGLALNEGEISAQSVTLNSTRASLQSGSIQAGDILILSAGSAIQTGWLRAETAEVSGSHVQLTRGLQNGGQLLIDPQNLSIVAAGGTRVPDILAGDDAGTNQSVDASALDPVAGGVVRLEATDTISLGPSVDVLLTHPNVDLRLSAPNVIMATSSSIQASQPGDKLTINATGRVDLSRIAVSDLRVVGGDVHLQGDLGMAAAPNQIDIQGNQVAWDGAVRVGGGTSLAANITGSTSLNSGAGSVLDFVGPSSYAKMSAGAGGIQLNQSQVRLQGAGNLTLSSGGGITLSNASSLSASGAANISLTASGPIDLQGSRISSSHPASSAILNGGALRLGSLEIPNVQATTNGELSFTNALLGLAGQAEQAHFTATRFVQHPGAGLTVVGTTANLLIDCGVDFELQTGAGLSLTAGVTNLQIHSHDSGTIQANAFIQAHGPANVTLLADHGTLFFANGSAVSLDGVGSLNVTNPVGAIIMQDGARIGAADPLASLHLQAGTDIQVGDLPASHINIDGNSAFAPLSGTVAFQNSHLGASGTDSVLNVTAHNVDFSAGNHSLLQGQHFGISLNASNDVKFSQASQTLVETKQTDFSLHNGGTFLMEAGSRLTDLGAGNYSIESGWISSDPDAQILLAGPGSHLGMSSQNDATLGHLDVAHTDVTAGGNLFLLGNRLGQAGQPSSLNATAQADLAFATNQLQLNGSSVNVTLSAGGALQNFVPPLVLQSSSPTRLEIRSDTMDLTSSNISLASGSNVSLQTQGNLTVDQLSSGRIQLTSGAGNLTLLSPFQADQVVLAAGQDLIALSPTPLTARQSLEVTASHIRGPVDLAPAGLVSALPFTTDAGANVNFQVTGSNQTQLGNRAANLLYVSSSDQNVQINSPNGEVLLYREGSQGAGAPIQSGSLELSPSQHAELSSQTALVQVGLSNLYSARNMPQTGSVLFLRPDNPGLIQFWPVSLLTPVVELVVLSPEELVDRQRRRDQAAINVVVADDEDEALRYWRRLLQGFIIWESE